MGITGLIPFLEKASRRASVDEFSGCTVAVDSYCWLHKGAFACADKLVRGEDTDIHIKYCLKYVSMLLSKNIKPVLVFDGRHLPAKAMTESKRRESRDISKKRAAELLSLGKIEEARSYMRRSVDITHKMALSLIQECRRRKVDCIVAPYEADAQLAYLNIKNIVQLVITEDSDLILFGCTKVLFKMDLDGMGTLVETAKLPLVMKCPIEHYTFDKFRHMCIMSGCDYLPSLPGIGLAKARQFVTASQDPNIANALRKLPSYFNRMSLTVTDGYRENFLKAEATFKHQYVYDPLERKMVRLTEPDDDDVETALCVNAGELLDPDIAFQLALGNIDPFTLKKMDDWHPDYGTPENDKVKTDSWKEPTVSKHTSIWSKEFSAHLDEACPWQRKPKTLEPIIAAPQIRARKKVVSLVSKYVPETQDDSLTIESLSNMYCVEPVTKKQKLTCSRNLSETYTHDTQSPLDVALVEDEKESPDQNKKSPILENKYRTFKKSLKNGTYSVFQRLSKFPRTIVDNVNVVESKFFTSSSSNDKDVDSNDKDVDSNDKDVDFNDKDVDSNDKDVNSNDKDVDSNDKGTSQDCILIEDSPEKKSRNPFKVKSVADINKILEIEFQNSQKHDVDYYPLDFETQEEIPDSQKENSEFICLGNQTSPILEPSPGHSSVLGLKSDIKLVDMLSEDSAIENTYPLERLVTPVDSQLSFGCSSPRPMPCNASEPQPVSSSQPIKSVVKKATCRVPGLKRTASLPSNQPTLLSKFGFQKKSVLKW